MFACLTFHLMQLLICLFPLISCVFNEEKSSPVIDGDISLILGAGLVQFCTRRHVVCVLFIGYPLCSERYFSVYFDFCLLLLLFFYCTIHFLRLRCLISLVSPQKGILCIDIPFSEYFTFPHSVSYGKIKKKSLEDEIDLLPASFKARAPHVYPSDPALQFSVAHPWSGF